MILKQRHIELDGRAVISHFKFKPPLMAASELENHGCFIFPINTSGKIYRANGLSQVHSKQGVLMKCGTYINHWKAEQTNPTSEVVILRLFPEVLEKALDTSTMVQLKKQLKQRTSTAIIDLDEWFFKYLESLFFYFDNPNLLSDELVALKLKELTLLLIHSKAPSAVLELLGALGQQEYFSIKEIVEAHLFSNLSLNQLAALANMSTATFKRRCKETLGKSPGQYIKERRLEEAANYLLSTQNRVATIAYDCGFSDPNYFSKAFQKKYNCSPLEYRKNSFS